MKQGSDEPRVTQTQRLDKVARMRHRAERFEKQRHETPDALKDGTKLRKKRAARMFGDGDGLACRLLSATDHRLKFVTVPLVPGTPAELYAHETKNHARTISRAVFGRSPVWCKLERGLDGGLHLHLLGAADALLMLPPRSQVKDVEPTDADHRRVLAYLCKPADARACMVKLGPQLYTKPDSDLLAAAVLDYRQARAAGRLPGLTWSHNLPRLKPDAALVRPA